MTSYLLAYIELFKFCFTVIVMAFVLFKVPNKSNFRDRLKHQNLKNWGSFTLKNGG